ncbi:MAG: DUF2905 domain-containing protein [Dehalococcoidia bacterium]|nr:DUF2905 domain-containing protein [Dehalococcoidia bacterium]
MPFLRKLPGDILLERGRSQLFFPIVACLAISILFTIVVSLIIRLSG